MKKNYLQNATVLVTGGTGFVGSHVVEELINMKSRVITTTQSQNPQSYFYSQSLQNKVTVVEVNISDFNELFAIVTKFEVDFIFHLAAQPLVETAFYNPVETLQTNIMGTVNVLECVRRYPKIKGVISASSDKAYGKMPKKTKYIEADRLAGDHPYEVSKSAADLICTSYYKTYNTPVITTRFGNIYGEGDLNFSRIIPAIFSSVITGDTLQVRSDGTYIRDYIYVKDVAKGYIALAQNIAKYAGDVFNFGSSDTLSVLDIIKLVNKMFKTTINYSINNTAQNEIPYQSLNYSKIQKSIGWRPSKTVSQILPTVFEWYKRAISAK